MHIDWKALAQSPGYRSLKAAYIRDVHEAGQRTNPMRKKKEFLKLFRWVIARAQHYAHARGTSVETVLNEWESNRNRSWWLNFYGETQQPKLGSGKPRNVKHMRPDTYFRRDAWYSNDPVRRIKRIKEHRQTQARIDRKNAGKKPRWSKEHKDRMAQIRSYRQQDL